MGLYLPGTGLAYGSISAGDGAAWGLRGQRLGGGEDAPAKMGKKKTQHIN